MIFQREGRKREGERGAESAGKTERERSKTVCEREQLIVHSIIQKDREGIEKNKMEEEG